jgi:hypothetical protein
MDTLRTGLILLIVIAQVAAATPLDTAYDFLYAVESGDGDAFLETLTESLRQSITYQLEEIRKLVLEDGSLAGAFLPRFGVTMWELENLSLTDLLGKVLLSVALYPSWDVGREEVTMEGREADVTLHWPDGGSLSFEMVWEESSWRISGSDLFSMLFH